MNIFNFYCSIGTKAKWSSWVDDLLVLGFIEHIDIKLLEMYPEAWKLILKFGDIKQVDWNVLGSKFTDSKLTY